MQGGSKYILPGAKEPIEIQLLDEDSKPLPGKTDIFIQIRRHQDDLYFDWSDNTFKWPSTVITRHQVLSEVSAAYSPGIYRLDAGPTHAKGFNTAAITNPGTADVYDIDVVQIGGTDALGLPQGYELHIYDLTVGLPAVIADAVWNAMQVDHRVVGSFGELVQRIVALQKENYYIDNMTYNTQGLMLTGRIRLFYNKTDANAATPGGSGQGEFATYTFTTTPTLGHPERAATARSVKEP